MLASQFGADQEMQAGGVDDGDRAAVAADQPVVFPQAELAVHALARRADHVREVALGQLDGQCKEVELAQRSEEHTSELQSLMRISYAVFCLKKKRKTI